MGWEDFKCPWGGHRPILEPDRVLTEEGYKYLGDSQAAPAGPRIVCPKCFPGEVAEVALQIIDIEGRGERITRLVKVTGEVNQFCPVHGPVENPLVIDLDAIKAKMAEAVNATEEGAVFDTFGTVDLNSAPEDGPQQANAKADDGNTEGNQPFKCETCGKAFAKKLYLTNHMRSHK